LHDAEALVPVWRRRNGAVLALVSVWAGAVYGDGGGRGDDVGAVYDGGGGNHHPNHTQ